MSWLAGIYLSAGLAYMAPHASPQSRGFSYWNYDITNIVNPYGSLEIGWHKDFGRIALELAARHESSIPAQDFGQNTAEVRLRWRPFE